MSQLISHRGPDSAGHLASQHEHVHLGFRRLAIRDLNPRANQPMVSASGRTAVVFNGEVYNSEDLAERFLPGHSLRTSGDTEVVLETLERHGLTVLDQFNGMFALALLDIASGRMYLVRDRMGKKPLYLYMETGILAFASELRSLKPFGLRVNPRLIELFLHFGYFPSPYTFYENTIQVRPGEIVEVHQGTVVGRRRFHRFADEPWGSRIVADEDLELALADAVRVRKLSDVPLGAFLSGGIDSALVASILHTREAAPPPTFTVQFGEQRYDESEDAATTAAELGLPHLVIPIEERDLTSLATDFLDCYEQPYADTSGLVTMLLCRAVKRHVTVALSGDGGDEFHGGYARYRWFQWALRAQQSPRLARRLAGQILQMVDRRRGHRLADWLGAGDPAALYCAILRNWNAFPNRPLINVDCPQDTTPLLLVREVFEGTCGDDLARAACFDATYYIPDDLQVKLDRASMAVALEVRCPLLDYRVASLGAATLSAEKYRAGLKTVLKRLLAQRVSPLVLQRPKKGFSVPLSSWLQGPLKSLVTDSLRQQRVRESGWLDVRVMQRVWEVFLRGNTQYAHSVWMLLSMIHHLRQEPVDPRYQQLRESVRRKAA